MHLSSQMIFERSLELGNLYVAREKREPAGIFFIFIFFIFRMGSKPPAGSRGTAAGHGVQAEDSLKLRAF